MQRHFGQKPKAKEAAAAEHFAECLPCFVVLSRKRVLEGGWSGLGTDVGSGRGDVLRSYRLHSAQIWYLGGAKACRPYVF